MRTKKLIKWILSWGLIVQLLSTFAFVFLSVGGGIYAKVAAIILAAALLGSFVYALWAVGVRQNVFTNDLFLSYEELQKEREKVAKEWRDVERYAKAIGHHEAVKLYALREHRYKDSNGTEYFMKHRNILGPGGVKYVLYRELRGEEREFIVERTFFENNFTKINTDGEENNDQGRV